MRINREAKGSAYLQRSQLLPRKSLQNINYHCCSAGFTPLKYQRQDFVSKIVHTMGPMKPKRRICGILLPLVDSLLKYVCLKTQGQNPQMHRTGAGRVLQPALGSTHEATAGFSKASCLRQQEQPLLIKPRGEFLVHS